MKSSNSIVNLLLQFRNLDFVCSSSFKLDGARFYLEIETWRSSISEDECRSLSQLIWSFGFVISEPCFYSHRDGLDCLCLLYRIDAYKAASFNADLFDE